MSDLHEENEMLKQLLKESTMQEIKKAFSQKDWVGLTEDEVIELLPVGEWDIEWVFVLASCIEAKLKEKNT